MKKVTQEILIGYINKHPEPEVFDFDMFRLFQYYSTLENINDSNIVQAIEDFKNFWLSNFHLIKCSPLQKEELKTSIFQELDTIYQTITGARNQDVKTFANIVDTIAPVKCPNILDVGSGKYPYSSIVLAEKHDKVTSIDRGFIVSNKYLERINVKVINAYFNQNTNVDPYDFVVGRYPCSAIEHMVLRCAKANKPYFIQLCPCNAPNIQTTSKFFWQKWQYYLVSIDPNINFFHNYAFNLDMSTEQVKSVIKQIRGVQHLYESHPLNPNYESKKFFIKPPLKQSFQNNEEEIEK